MAKKKMCKYHKPNRRNWYGGNCFRPDRIIDCPKYTGEKCEIIPKKAKAIKRVKAWAFHSLKKGAICAATYKAPGKVCFPCTVLVDEKYLKGKP